MANIIVLYEVFQAFYAVTKFTLGLPPRNNNIYVRIFIVLATLSLLILSVLFLLICGLFFGILRVYLKFKEGKRFVGMLIGLDSYWSFLNINILFTVTATESHEEIMGRLRPSMERVYESCKKLRCLIRTCLGYYYLVQSDLELDNYITEISREDVQFWTKTDLLNYVGSNLAKPGSLKDKTWELTVFEQPIQWEDGSIKYGFVLTFNHSVSDGIGIMSLLKNMFCEKFEFLNLTTNANHPIPSLKSLDCAYMYSQHRNPGSIRGQKFKHFLSLFIEDQPKYVHLIKELKMKLNVTFNEIILAGFSMAFKEYWDKKHIRLQILNIYYTLRAFDSETQQMIDGNYDYNKLSNNPTVASLSLDLDSCKDMLETIRNLHQISREFAESSNILLSKIVGNITHLLPPFCTQLCLSKFFVSTSISMSNVTGITGNVEVGGLVIEDIVFFLSPLSTSDLVICVLTQANKFHLSVVGRTDVVDSKEDLDAIVIRAFQHIDSLNQN